MNLDTAAQAIVVPFASTPSERQLIADWTETSKPTGASWTQLPADPEGTDRVLSAADPDALVLAVRVLWNGSNTVGGRAGRAASVFNSRLPIERLQSFHLHRDAGAARVLAGDAATVQELRERFDIETAGAIPFARFIRMQGELSLDRTERRLVRSRYKLPRFVLEEVRSSRRFADGVRRLGRDTGRRPEDIATQCTAYLKEMVADHSRLAIDAFERFSRYLTRAYTVDVDPDQLAGLKELNKTHSLVFLPSHRSYLDVFILRSTLLANGFPANSCFGGNNMAFWPMGDWMRRTGNIVLRRSVGDDPVYKFVLRTYLQFLVSKRLNLEWYIEGGRTRTGKLRPPKYGLLSYLVDAVEELDDETAQPYLVPMSVTYDGLAEVSSLTAEQTGKQKRAEQVSWLLSYPRSTGAGFGKVHLRISEPIDLRRALGRYPDASRRERVQKVAFEVCHQINQATPVTSTALVTLALLGVDERALTMDQIRAVLAPFLEYFGQRKLAVTVDLAGSTELGEVLDWLTSTGVVTRYDGGTETVWSIAPGRHLDAAFYRNSVLHHLVDRAIVELVLAAAAQGLLSTEEQAWEESLRIRDLLKFEFFFPEKAEFRRNLEAEMEIIDQGWRAHLDEPDAWTKILAEARPHLAYRALHSFVETYYATAQRLAELPPHEVIEEKKLIQDCYGIARQQRMQHDLRSSDAISTEVIRNALLIASNRGLLATGAEEITQARRAFANELGHLLGRLEAMRDPLHVMSA